MAETSKLRFVRCPKCGKLLQELPDYSIYQCGGCGTTLRAQLGNLDRNIGSRRFDVKRVGIVSDNSEKFSGKPEINLGKNAVSGTENAEGKVLDGDGSCETISAKHGNGLKPELGKCIVEGENSRSYVGNEKLMPRFDNLENQTDSLNGLTRSGRFLECKLSDKQMEDQLWRMGRDHFERGRFSSSYQFYEAPSSIKGDTSYQNQACRSTRAESFNHDQEELLRKLDELKDQLIRFQNVNGKFPEKIPVEHKVIEHRVDYSDYFRDHPSSYHQIASHLPTSTNYIARPPCFECYHEHRPVINGSDVASHNHHNSVNGSNHVPRFEDPCEPQIFARTHPEIVPGHHHYNSLQLDPFKPHPCSTTLNQLSCTCYQCYSRQVPPSDSFNRRFAHICNRSVQCHHKVHTASYNARDADNPPMGSCESKFRTKKPSNLNVEVGGFSHTCPRRVLAAKENLCRAIAGGAPFLTCHNCFKLLKLPKKVSYNEDEWKMSCGACRSVISFAIVNGKLVSLHTTGHSTSDDLDSSNNFGNSRNSCLKRDNASFCSEDYANSVYDYQAMDRGCVSSSTCQDISTTKSEEMKNNFSATEDETLSDILIAKRGGTSTLEAHEKTDFYPSHLGSPPQDAFDYSAKNRAVNRGGKGSLSNRLEKKQFMTNKSTQRHASLKESLATEVVIPLDDYADPEESQDSAEREDDQQKSKKGLDSFLAGIIKKSFKDLSRSNQTTGSGKRNVTVNGHMIPDKLVKTAEKLAGPICPGKYWYDSRAGFWGIIGGPCLGIIPPSIQEFNYPIPEKCAGGNTGVFVNGRELHKKDLDLLASRGLPAARARSYIVDLSGKVVDKDSGKELVNLGKLAPTVEKLRCGFGMRAPEAAA